MIVFTKIQASDAFSYRYLDFDFRTGLSAIEGTNGSSKSSIFMTLCQGLFNRNPKGCKVDEVNNFITGKPYEITIHFTKGTEEYVVCNSRKQGKITVTLNGKDVSLKRMPENLVLISDILGTDYTTFTDLVYQSKDSTLNILETSTDKGRKEFVSRILKLDEIDSLLTKTKEKIKELDGKNGRISNLSSTINALDATLATPVECEDEQDYSELQKAIDTLQAELVEVTADRDRVAQELKEVEAEVSAWEAEKKLRTQISTLQQKVEEGWDKVDSQAYQSGMVEYYARITETKNSIANKRELIAKLERVAKTRTVLQSTEEALDMQVLPEMSHEDCKIQYDKIGKASSARQNKLDSTLKEIKKFEAAQAQGICPTCGNHADVSDQIKSLQEVVRIDTEFVEKCTISYEKYKGWIKTWEFRNGLQQTAERLRAELIDVPDTTVEQVAEELDKLTDFLCAFEEEYNALKERLNKVTEQNKLRMQILELQAKITRGDECKYSLKYEDNLRVELGFYSNKLKEGKDELGQLTSQLTSIKEHNAKVRATVALNTRIEANNLKVQLQIDQLAKEQADCEDKLELLRTWQGILGGKGYRVSRIRKFVGSLNQLMGKYAQMISNGRIRCNFFLTDTGEIDFTITDEAKEMSYELWSGGEKARVKLVCLFAVLELLESMGSISFNVLALDEIFDQLDSEGKEGLFNVLSYLKGHNKAVYTIAHSDLVLDLVYDYKVIANKLSDGTTEVKYVTSTS